MIKLLFSLIIAISLNASDFIQQDKTEHLLAGAALYFGCLFVGEVSKLEYINKKTCLIPVAAAAVSKEIYDSTQSNHTSEFNDLTATMFIPLVSFTVMEW